MVGIVKVDRVEHGAKAQDDVRPALAAGRAVVEFAHLRPVGGLFETARGSLGGEPVEHAELALAQSLVDDRRPVRRRGRRLANRLRGLARDIGR